MSKRTQGLKPQSSAWLDRESSPPIDAGIDFAKANEEKLKHWLSFAFDEYKNTFFVLRNKQLDIIKTYLWLCSALLTFELYFINDLYRWNVTLIKCAPDSIFLLLSLSSIGMSVFAFMLCVSAMTVSVKAGETFPFSFDGDGDNALKYFSTQTVLEYLKENISTVHASIRSERGIIQHTGKRLRLIGLLISMPLLFQVLSISWLCSLSLYKHAARIGF